MQPMGLVSPDATADDFVQHHQWPTSEPAMKRMQRMSKSQQMLWSPESVHLLIQVRTSVLDGRLREDFARWYPGFAVNDSVQQKRV